MIHSNYPSICGWKAVLRFKRVPTAHWKDPGLSSIGGRKPRQTYLDILDSEASLEHSKLSSSIKPI